MLELLFLIVTFNMLYAATFQSTRSLVVQNFSSDEQI